jgi:hypothetical protein
VSRRRVLIDIEFAVDEDRFKVSQLSDDAEGVSDVTDPGVRDAVSQALVETDWAERGLAPLRSVVTTRAQRDDGLYKGTRVEPDPGVARP